MSKTILIGQSDDEVKPVIVSLLEEKGIHLVRSYGNILVKIKFEDVAGAVVILQQVKNTSQDSFVCSNAQRILKRINHAVDDAYGALLLKGDGPSEEDLRTKSDEELDAEFFRTPAEAAAMVKEMTGGYLPEKLVKELESDKEDKFEIIFYIDGREFHRDVANSLYDLLIMKGSVDLEIEKDPEYWKGVTAKLTMNGSDKIPLSKWAEAKCKMVCEVKELRGHDTE